MKKEKESKKPEAKKPEVKKSADKLYRITKPNGKVIERYNLGDYVKTYEAKGYKVEEI